MTARQSHPKGAKVRSHATNDGKRKIVVPKKATGKERELFEQLAEASIFDPRAA